MKIFDKEYLDLLTTSPGNYIFKGKSNKSEFGKFLSLSYIFISIILLIYYLYLYVKGSEMNIIYTKKYTNKILFFLDEDKKDEYKRFDKNEKEFYLGISAENECEIDISKNTNISIESNNEQINFTKESYENYYNIYFTAGSSYYFNILINKTENFSCNNLIISFSYTTSSINSEDKIIMKENYEMNTEYLFVDANKYNEFYLKKNYIVYRDGIKLKNFYNLLKFWTHYETNYVDFYYDIYDHFFYDNKDTNEFVNIMMIGPHENIISNIDYYQREYESLLTVLSKWCGLFSTLKIFFTNLVYIFSFSYNNYELVKYINKKYESNKNSIHSINNNFIVDNNNNKYENKEFKNIELNKINDNKIKKFNKIKNFDIFKNVFFGCCFSKSKTNKIIKECNNYVTEHISIEKIFYNMLLFEYFIQDYKFKDNNNLIKFEEMKKKLDLYEFEMNLTKEKNTNLIQLTSNSINDEN